MPTKLLIVDDEIPFVRSLSAHLQRCGYEVLVAFEARQAIQAINDEHPALALVDLKLPGLGGEALVRQVKQISPQTKVIVLTAYRDEGLKEAALRQAGVAGYLYKPLKSLLELERHIEEVLGSPPRL